MLTQIRATTGALCKLLALAACDREDYRMLSSARRARLLWYLSIAAILLDVSVTTVTAESASPEIVFWESVRDTKDPLELESYLKAYPSGVFSGLARLRLEKLGSRSDSMVEDDKNRNGESATRYLAAAEGGDREALSRLERLAVRRNPQALYGLGWLYHMGRVVEKDEEKAISFLCRASILGSPLADRVLDGIIGLTGDKPVLFDDPIFRKFFEKEASRSGWEPKAQLVEAHAQICEHHWGRIGISVETVTENVASASGLGKVAGAIVVALEPAGPGEQAGLVQGDIILNIDGTEVTDDQSASRLIRGTLIGKTVDIVVQHQGERRSLKVKVGQWGGKSKSREVGEEEENGDVSDLGLDALERLEKLE